MARPENNNQLSELKEKCLRLFKVHLTLILSQIKEKRNRNKTRWLKKQECRLTVSY